MKLVCRIKIQRGLTALFLALTGPLVFFSGIATALTPAGTTIPNVASLSSLLSGSLVLLDSNTVTVGITQLNLVTINPPQTTTVKPDKTATLVHTVTNTGNVADTFNLEATNLWGASVLFFAADGVTPLTDTNGDGKVDTGLMASGTSLDIVVKLTAPGSAVPGRVEQTIIKAVSIANPSVTASITDSATILNPRFWDPLTKSVSPAGQITQGSTLTYTNTFGNSGNAPAINIVITDQLDPNLIYLDGSATPPPGISGTIITYDPAARTVSWTIPSIPAGYVGSVSFKARINPDTVSDTNIENTIRIVSDQNPEVQASNAVSTPVVEQPLRVSKKAARTEAEIGDYVGYTVTVENVSKALTANEVQVIDSLPQGFRYMKGSSSLDNLPLAEPTGGTTRTWEIGTLEPGKKKEIVYRSLVSIDAPLGDGINSALAAGKSPTGNKLFSFPAIAKVKILEGVLNSKVTILGRVFVDLNRDRMPDQGEPGMKGIRLYLEDGSYVITDGEGKFSFSGINAGEHVLKIDRNTLPAGFEPEVLDSTFAGDGNSRFISVPFGGMARGDFGLISVKKEEAPKPADKKNAPKEERVFTFGAELNPGSPSLEQQISTMPDSPEILEPARGSILRKTWTDIVIRIPDGAEYTLRINGTPLLQKQIGKTIVESKRKIRICQYVGVKLEAGTNQVVLEVTRPGGKPELKEIEIIAPGDAVKLEVSPDKANIPADGKTLLPFTVTFLDKANHPVVGDIIYTIVSEKGELVEPDLDPAKAGHQLRAVDGKGSFHLRAGLKTGAERIKVIAGTSLEGGSDLFFTPEMRDWIVVGLGSLTVGSNSVSGHIEKITKDDHFQDGIYEDGRLAFFAKGKILGEYLMTAAYDSKKEEQKELFQRVEPNRYYPIYGDASVKGYDAESSKKYYLKIEKGRSSVLVGDFNTNLSPNEFSRYDRSFNGIKADIDTKNATLRAFGTSTNHSANRDEIPGNGTSGYYFLSKKPIVENTDKIRIEVRDRYHTERVISTTDKTPYNDYSLDYRTGAILFREPVPSYDGNLNPVRIVAVYESEDQGDNNFIFGGRAAIRSDKGSEVGVTAIVEQKGNGSNSLYGVDGTLAITDKTSLKVEAARSNTVEKGSGQAWKAEVSTQLYKARIDAYYRHLDQNFQNISMSGGESGSNKYGAKVSYTLLEKTQLILDSFVQSDLIGGTKLTSTTLGASHQFKKIMLNSGFKLLQGRDSNGLETTSQMAFAGVSGKLTEKLDGSIMQEQAFSSATVKDYPSRTLLKLNYKLTEKTSAFVTEELQESGPNRKNNTVFGITTKLRDNMILTNNYQETTGADRNRQIGTEISSKWNPSKELTFTTKTGYQLQNSMTGDRGQALLGVDTSWEAMKGLKIGAKAERVQVVTGPNDPGGVNTALALSAEYLAREDVKTSGRYELRLSPSETTHLYSLGGTWKLSQNISLQGKGTFWSSAKATGTDILFDGEIGGSYRPLGRNSLYLLGVLRFKDDSKGSTPTGDETKSMIASVEFSERLRPDLTFNGKYAGKLSWETLSGQKFSSYTDMLLAGVTYDINDHWDIGIAAKLMNQYGTNMSSLGFIPQVGYRVYKNVRAAVGYNYSRLNDRDLAGEGYSSSGPFVQLKFKFDEMTIEDLYKRITAKPSVEPLPLPVPPAPKPVMVILKAALTEEPLEILGSVEALKLLVNDHEAMFQNGNVKLGTQSVDEIIELKGSELDKPLEFQVDVSAPEKVVSWSLAVATMQGDLLHLVSGKGKPTALIVWNGRSERNEPLKGGEIYQYRIEVEYSDGSHITSPFRLFGLNRTSAVAMSLTGGAFQSGSDTLSVKARSILKETAVVLRKYEKEKIVVEGHTDAVGDEAANLELSRKRSQAAADYLINIEKIPAERIIVRWFGMSKPLSSNAIAEGRELNRRVEVKGEFHETKKAVILDQRREPPFVRINRSPVKIDEFGRFARTLTEKSERIEIEMGNSQGRSVKTSLALPNVILIEPAGGEARVLSPINGSDPNARPELKITYKFVGKAMPGGTLTLNGKEVPVAQDGTFSFSLELVEGEATYWLQVRSPEGYGKNVRLEVSVAAEGAAAKPQKIVGEKGVSTGVTDAPAIKAVSRSNDSNKMDKTAAAALPILMPVAAPITKKEKVSKKSAVSSVSAAVSAIESKKIAINNKAGKTEQEITGSSLEVTADNLIAKEYKDSSDHIEVPDGKSDKPAKTGAYQLKFGEFITAGAVSDAKYKIEKAGLKPELKQGPKKDEPMIRLFVNEFSDQKTARKLLARLLNAKIDGFIISDDQCSSVYAGSYFDQEAAKFEVARLSKIGIKVTLIKQLVPVSTQVLFAGNFSTRESALQGAEKLQQSGLKAVVVEKENSSAKE